MLGYDELIEKIETFVELQQGIALDEEIKKEIAAEIAMASRLPDYVRSRIEHEKLREQIGSKYILKSREAAARERIKKSQERLMSIREDLIAQLPENVLFLVPVDEKDYAVGVYIINGPGRPNTKVLFLEEWKDDLPPLRSKSNQN